jgi:iron complex outermembrane receptor protein
MIQLVALSLSFLVVLLGQLVSDPPAAASPPDAGPPAPADAGAPDAGTPPPTTTRPPEATSPAPPAAPVEPAAVEPADTGAETIVTATTPLHGSRLPRERVPANVQTVTADAIAARHSLDLADYMLDALGSVSTNQVQQNPLQPDFQYRGFLASPLLGAPQGLSVYIDGVRLNEPFGDTLSWDLIPTEAVRSANLMPGSNPLYGLNTLGGALSIETKTGFSDPGAEVHLLGGSFGRRLLDVGIGGHGERWGVFAAGRYFAEDGWRPFSPSRTASAFLATTYQNGATSAELSLAAADTTLYGNGPVPRDLLLQDRRQIFTHPDITDNRMFMAIARGERPVAARMHLSGLAYYRASRIATRNGDQANWLACQDAAQAGFTCTADDDGVETPVLDDAGNPIPFDTANPYDAADNSTHTRQHGYGAAVQLAVDRPLAARENHFSVGAVANEGRASFDAASALARLINRGTVSSGIVDAASRVVVDSVSRDLGLYATDTFSLRRDLFLTASLRFNVSALTLEDRLGDALSGHHVFNRLNPALGVSYQPLPVVGGYAGYSESTRAPTPLELTCASETDPCRLPNGFIADPPLRAVVARTFEMGVRGRWKRERGTLDYVVAAFRTTNADDILFISSGAVANRGYFSNVGDTRRQGIEASLQGRRRFGAGGANGRVEWAVHYTYLDARFLTAFSELSETHPAAVDGSIEVPAGARIPSVPAHIGKAVVTWFSGARFSLGLDGILNSGQYHRGDEANLLPQVPGYLVMNLRGAYRLARPLSVFAIVSNLFDAHYSSFGVLGDARPVLGPAYADPRFIGPGAPRAAWVGVDVNY